VVLGGEDVLLGARAVEAGPGLRVGRVFDGGVAAGLAVPLAERLALEGDVERDGEPAGHAERHAQI
jgi:hypothetical protein